MPSAWPYPRVEHWRTLPRARAVENLSYVAAVNGSGAFGDEALGSRRVQSVRRFRPERAVFRHHRPVALLLTVAAGCYLLRMNAGGLLWPGAELGPWSPVIRAATVAMALLLPLTVTLYVRPSLLRPAEARLNRWIGPPERPAPRWLQVAAGLYCFPALIWLLVERMN